MFFLFIGKYVNEGSTKIFVKFCELGVCRIFDYIMSQGLLVINDCK